MWTVVQIFLQQVEPQRVTLPLLEVELGFVKKNNPPFHNCRVEDGDVYACLMLRVLLGVWDVLPTGVLRNLEEDLGETSRHKVRFVSATSPGIWSWSWVVAGFQVVAMKRRLFRCTNVWVASRFLLVSSDYDLQSTFQQIVKLLEWKAFKSEVMVLSQYGMDCFLWVLSPSLPLVAWTDWSLLCSNSGTAQICKG